MLAGKRLAVFLFAGLCSYPPGIFSTSKIYAVGSDNEPVTVDQQSSPGLDCRPGLSFQLQVSIRANRASRPRPCTHDPVRYPCTQDALSHTVATNHGQANRQNRMDAVKSPPSDLLA